MTIPTYPSFEYMLEHMKSTSSYLEAKEKELVDKEYRIYMLEKNFFTEWEKFELFSSSTAFKQHVDKKPEDKLGRLMAHRPYTGSSLSFLRLAKKYPEKFPHLNTSEYEVEQEEQDDDEDEKPPKIEPEAPTTEAEADAEAEEKRNERRKRRRESRQNGGASTSEKMNGIDGPPTLSPKRSIPRKKRRGGSD